MKNTSLTAGSCTNREKASGPNSSRAVRCAVAYFLALCIVAITHQHMAGGYQVNRDEFIAKNPIVTVLEHRGVKVPGGGTQRAVKCPFHEDRTASMSVNITTGLWHCHAGCGGGSVIDLIAKFDNVSIADVLKRGVVNGNGNGFRKRFEFKDEAEPLKWETIATYNYEDSFGNVAYQVVRQHAPAKDKECGYVKTFRQRRPVANGWAWDMEGVERVLYRLPHWAQEKSVWICFAQDTEVLTPRGWLPFPSLTTDHTIAQYEPTTGEISFVHPESVQCFEFDGEAVNFNSRWQDALVTPDHPMLVKSPLARNRWSDPREVQAESVRDNWKLPASGNYKGCTHPITENQARILASVQADGLFPRGFHLEWNIKKERKKERVRTLLTQEGITWREKAFKSCPDWTLFIVDDRRTLGFLSELDDKHFDWSMVEWDLPLRQALLDELRHWDGDTVGERGHRFFTSDKNDAEIISAMAAITGFSSTMRTVNRGRKNAGPEYIVSLTKADWRSTKKRFEHYAGKVFCCTVPTHCILTRRNGKCLITKQCEGEKDAETLVSLGFNATCNVGGAGKWLDAYTESLQKKHVTICGDNDEPGQKHVKTVFDSIAGKVKTLRIVKVPQSHKDVSDFAASFENKEDCKRALNALWDAATPHVKGVGVPIFKVSELEAGYKRFVDNLKHAAYNLGKWLPGMWKLRGLVPGDLALILASTGIGKTASLTNIAKSASPIPTLFFQMELPESKMFERTVALTRNIACKEIEKIYRGGDELGEAAIDADWPHVYICTQPALTVKDLETLVVRSELKIGTRPKLVLLDYVQLMKGQGKSRYERMSNVAEDLKTAAKSMQVIIIVSSQVARKPDDSPEITLHDAKDSGSLENSSGLVLGLWRTDDGKGAKLRVLKSTTGGAGMTFDCDYNVETLAITERSKLA